MEGFQPETIHDVPIPLIDGSAYTATFPSSSAAPGGFSPTQTKDKALPETIVAHDMQSIALDTLSRKILGNFSFGKVGALQIGEYANGVSGDVRITPNGITARNVNGTTTFSLDGTTGDATFAGTLAAGTIISGTLNVGSANVVIDGLNGRILVNDGSNDRILIGYQLNGF